MRARSAEAAGALGLALLIASCSLVDLRTVSVSTEPSAAGALLPDLRSPLKVAFGAEVVRAAAEAAFSVKGELGAAEGDFLWSGRGFAFAPREPWKPGVRYRLVLDGAIPCADGREARPRLDLPFFAVRGPGAPRLVASSPAEGASVFPDPQRGGAVELEFSEPMDEASVEAAFSLSPGADLSFSWNGDRTRFRAAPGSSLEPCAAYLWKLGGTARAADGAPLARAEEGRFSSDGDREAPRVLRSWAAVSGADGTWLDSGLGLEASGPGDGFGLSFSEPMDEASLRAAFSLSPSLPGRLEACGPDRWVYVPDEPPAGGLVLSLRVAASATDRAGLPLAAEYRERFSPACPGLAVVSADAGSGAWTAAGTGTRPRLKAVPGAEGLVALALRFSEPLPASERARLVELAGLSAFFPPSLGTPGLLSLTWPDASCALFVWDGFDAGDSGNPAYYELRLRGASSGPRGQSGQVLAADFRLILECAP